MREGATEFHMVGGLHPDLPFEYFLDLMRGLKERCPGVHLKAFTMVEVGYFARISKLSIRDTLVALKDAGVDSLPGGGAEIFNPRVRKIICDHKVSGQQWLNIARTAHQIGLRSNATMLYGHIENDEERVEHLLALRNLQDETRGFVAFIPLAFHPENTGLAHLPKPTGFTDLKTIAISRLLLDNFDHIKAYWIMLTPRIAQIALRFGADDIDGTVVEEKIYHDAGATTAQFTSARPTRAPDPRGWPRARRARHALPPRRPLQDAAPSAADWRQPFHHRIAGISSAAAKCRVRS